jgi:transposase InsO family protein
VAALCRALGVTRQGYYAYAKRPPNPRQQEQQQLHARIRELHEENRQTYGSPRIREALRREGTRVSKTRVERAMRALRLETVVPRRFQVTTKADATQRFEDNVLDRDFTAVRPNERWVSDITYVETDRGWCYVAVILDLFSRAVVGWSVETTMHAKLATKALSMAIQRRRPGPGLLHHSDRGCQYTSTEYRDLLRNHGVTVSKSRKGDCWDNAVAESFFATLKRELLSRSQWPGPLAVRDAMFEYIETFYNRRRLHSTLGYKTPVQVESEHAATLGRAA